MRMICMNKNTLLQHSFDEDFTKIGTITCAHLKQLTRSALDVKRGCRFNDNMLPSYRTMKYKSPMWGYFHV